MTQLTVPPVDGAPGAAADGRRTRRAAPAAPQVADAADRSPARRTAAPVAVARRRRPDRARLRAGPGGRRLGLGAQPGVGHRPLRADDEPAGRRPRRADRADQPADRDGLPVRRRQAIADDAVDALGAQGLPPQLVTRLETLTPTLTSAVTGFVHDKIAELVASPAFDGPGTRPSRRRTGRWTRCCRATARASSSAGTPSTWTSRRSSTWPSSG